MSTPIFRETAWQSDSNPAGPGAGQRACYIDTEGLDALYSELKPSLDLLPEGRVRSPFDQPYGMREFHVLDGDNLLIFFGEPIPN